MTKSFPDQELAGRIEALVQRGHIDRGDPAYGVALNAVDLGYDRLTRAQRNLYDRVLVPAMEALDKGLPPAPAVPIVPPPRAAVARGASLVRDAGRADGWRPIGEAPEDRDVELAMMVDGKPNALAFACRRSNRSWVHATTGKPVYFHPSHWREWRG